MLGDAPRVRTALARDAELVRRPLGARAWLPLLYVTHSAFLGGERTDGLVACADALLAAGADPKKATRAGRTDRRGPQSALYTARPAVRTSRA